MDTRPVDHVREKTRRPIRNKRYSRRPFGEDRRPPKRLFTPEIKRFLKDWLVRRRENPYPNRDEKKLLAVQTGLTYIQVCNWFANWRRKLKNAGKEPQQKTWGDLIKTYNNQVQGNVEHFSICSDDSIWEESDKNSSCGNDTYDYRADPIRELRFDHTFSRNHFDNNNSDHQNQCYFISSTTEMESDFNPFAQPTNKYKNHIIEKYLRDCQQPKHITEDLHEESKPSMISKWLESAAKFKPKESSYIDWTFTKTPRKKTKKPTDTTNKMLLIHGREELDAAEALTTLANSRRNIGKPGC